MRPFGLGCVEMDIATNPAAAEATEAAVVLALLPAFETCSLLLDPIPLGLVVRKRLFFYYISADNLTYY